MKHLILISIILSSCSFKTSKEKKQMKLWTLSDYGQIENVVSNSCTLKDIEQTMAKLEWNKFHQVILEKPNSDLIEVGGSLVEDGFSVMYIEKGKEYVISTPPTTVNEMSNFLKWYLNEDLTYKTQYKFE